ncbi:MAG: hypothetical protein OXE44_03665 [Nitrospinae bacterium]|nr:hypothetical protein [Nitrospinota bacterium]
MQALKTLPKISRTFLTHTFGRGRAQDEAHDGIPESRLGDATRT